MGNRAQRRAAARQGQRAWRDDVAVAYPHPVGEIGARFHNSLVALQAYDLRGAYTPEGKRLGGNGRFAKHIPVSSGANIVTARNKIVRSFLETDAEWLWMVDSDMEFAPSTLDDLLEAADRDERPIVGGLCFALRRGAAQEVQPTLYSFNEQGLIVQWPDYPRNQLVQVAATGAACLLVHRSVFETMARFERDGERLFPPPWPWFAETVTGPDWGDTLSEDITFCIRAAMCGYPVYVHTGIKLGHVKPIVVDEPAFLSTRPVQEPPAPNYVVIPVRGRHRLTADLLRQLGEQDQYERIYVYDNAAGTPDALPPAADVYERHRVDVIPAAGMNIHEMWNAGVARAVAENPRCNIAILNNDLSIGPDFLARLGEGLRCHPSFAAVCGNYDGRDFPETVQGVKGICAGRYDGTGGFAGFAFMVRGELAQNGPLFDERLEYWWGDNLFLLTLEKAGLGYGIVRDATVEHLEVDGHRGSATDRLFAAETRKKKDRDRQRFEAIVAGLPLPMFKDAA